MPVAKFSFCCVAVMEELRGYIGNRHKFKKIYRYLTLHGASCS